jgi:hypothetical protein
MKVLELSAVDVSLEKKDKNAKNNCQSKVREVIATVLTLLPAALLVERETSQEFGDRLAAHQILSHIIYWRQLDYYFLSDSRRAAMYSEVNDSSEVTQAVLDSLNVSQARKENRECLDSLGGVEVLMRKLGTSMEAGLTPADVLKMREKFGRNAFPESPMKAFFELFFEALQDPTLMILIGASIVSLAIGIWEHGGEGWIEGGAILIAVFLVALVSAGNDYTKELQFRSLEKSSQQDERCSVIRQGNIERINPADLVIGDMVLLQVCTLYPLPLFPDSMVGR